MNWKAPEWKTKVALHSSGAFTGDELAVLKKQGAAVASVHPLMTFVPVGPIAASGTQNQIKSAFTMVPGGGIEPPRYSVPADFESAASASSAIPACVALLERGAKEQRANRNQA